MVKTVKVHHTFGDRVRIPELDTTGRVVSVWIGETGIQYNVRYFMQGELKTAYLMADELEPADKGADNGNPH